MYLGVYILNRFPLINSVLSHISYYFIGDSFREQQPSSSPLCYFTLSVYISRSTVIWRWSRLLLRRPPPPPWIPYKLLRRSCKPTARLPPFSPPGTLHILTFWKEDPVGWFHYAEAKFVVAGIPIHRYLCYNHVLRSLSYLQQVLLSRYTSTAIAIANCFRFIDHPDLGDRHPLTLFSDMQVLLPEDANILFNATISAAC
jgi:hypothetical protein